MRTPSVLRYGARVESTALLNLAAWLDQFHAGIRKDAA